MDTNKTPNLTPFTRLEALTELFSRHSPSGYLRLCKLRFKRGILEPRTIDKILSENGYIVEEPKIYKIEDIQANYTPNATTQPDDEPINL